jgi:hypothetical protein
LASDEPLAAGPAGLALSIVWLFFIWLLSGSDAFGASLIVSGPFFVLAFCSPGFNAGATFSAGAFCCAAGARAGASSLSIGCADAAPTLSSKAAATVDNSLAFIIIESSSGHLPTCLTLWRA